MSDYLKGLAAGPLLSKTARAALLPARVSTGAPADESETNRRRANTAAKRVADQRRDSDRLAALAASYASQGTPPVRSFRLVDGDTLLAQAKRTPGFSSKDAPSKADARADIWLGLLQEAGQDITDAHRIATRKAAQGGGE